MTCMPLGMDIKVLFQEVLDATKICVYSCLVLIVSKTLWGMAAACCLKGPHKDHLKCDYSDGTVYTLSKSEH